MEQNSPQATSQTLDDGITTNDSISQNQEKSTPETKKSKKSFKQQQFEVIEKANPALDEYHTWIRSADKITEKESSAQQTLHAAVNTRKGANGELFLDNSISQNQEKSTPDSKKVQYSRKTPLISPEGKKMFQTSIWIYLSKPNM